MRIRFEARDNLRLIDYFDQAETRIFSPYREELPELCKALSYVDLWLIVDDSLCVS